MVFVGVGGGFGHDASIAIVRNGRIEIVIEEERLARTKAARGMIPELALARALSVVGATPRDVRGVAFSWDSSLDPSNDRMAAADSAIDRSPRFRELASAPRWFVPHHDCHAVAALALSPPTRNRRAVVVMDGRGEHASTSVYLADNGNGPGELVAASPLTASLGTLFGAATKYCDFGIDGAGKTMGLAAYGTPIDAFPELVVEGLALHIDGDSSAGDNPTARHRSQFRSWVNRFVSVFGDPTGRRPDRSVGGQCVPGASADAAATAQQTLEVLVARLLNNVVMKLSVEEIVLTGGVALNCAMNGKLRQSLPGLRLNPIPHDAGVAIGAAVTLSERSGEPVAPTDSPYLGQGWNDEALACALNERGLVAWRPSRLEEEVAQRLSEGAAIGWFQGRAEIGPRALGHRSIIAKPGDIDTRGRLNRLKGREAWRPFGPSVTAEFAIRAFGATEFPYMVEAVSPSRHAAEQIGGAVHIDGTCRPQVPGCETSPRFAELLARVGDVTGAGGVINTSFNVGPEPIVNSPDDAVATFLRSDLDVLCMGPFLAVPSGSAA